MNPWLFRLARERPPAARLFCFAHAGGSAASYRLWQASLPEAIEVVAIQLPGRANRLREAPIAQMNALVDAVSVEIAGDLDRPFALFGHSMGATLAYELAHRLQDERRPLPSHLFISGRRAPHRPQRESDLHPLPDAQFVEQIGRRYGGIPAEILEHPDVMELLLPALRADIAALETHRPVSRSPLPVALWTFGGRDDARATYEDLEAWRDHTSADFRLRVFAGGHFYLEPGRDLLLGEIASAMAPLVAREWRSGA